MEAWLSHSTGAGPKNSQIWAKRPFTESMKMFFQTSAETDGIMKKGAITNMLAPPLPPDRLIEQQRQQRAADCGDQ